MTIKIGDALPAATFHLMTEEGVKTMTTDEVFKGKSVALFAVPGAFTGTCHKMHMPSITMNADAMRAKGIDTIVMLAVNDAFVMKAWKRDTDPNNDVLFLADGNGTFAKAIGMEFDGSNFGLGLRSKRYSMLIKDGIVKSINIEEKPGTVEKSGGDAFLAQL